MVFSLNIARLGSGISPLPISYISPGSPDCNIVVANLEISGGCMPSAGLGVAVKTIARFITREVRIYEQELREPFGSPLLGLYVRRWREEKVSSNSSSPSS
jgi:hypothetical protein